MKKIISTIFMATCLLFSLQAQVLDLEKTYEITGKSKRGTLAKVQVDANTGNYTLIYQTKASDTKVKFEVYSFDKDFNFINMEEEVIEFEKARVKYTWFKFKGDEYATVGNSVEPNLVGTLVLKKKQVTWKYDWWMGVYYKQVKVLEKVKPKTDDGRKLHYYAHTEDDVTGDIQVLCGLRPMIKANANDDPAMHMKKFVVLKFNKDLDIVKEVAFEAEFPQTMIFARMVGNYSEEENAPEVGGMALMFAPADGGKKASDPDATNYRYVVVDNECQIKEDIKFKSHASFWKVDEMITNLSNGDVYFFGPLASGKDKYYSALAATTKFKSVQAMKISNHKVEYITETNLEEFEAKLKTPPSQKKSPAYSGKKFEIANYRICSNGDFFVVGQNYNTSDEGNKYNDALGFHFDNKGVLKSQYGIDTRESNKWSKSMGTPQSFIEKDGKLFWILQEIKDVYEPRMKPLTYPRIGKVELAAGSLSDLVDFGRENKFYLDPKFPFLQSPDPNKIVFFGADKGGKTIWFCRVKME
jgi:hypothetical protein